MRRIVGYTEMVIGSLCDLSHEAMGYMTFGLSKAGDRRRAREADRDYMQRERHHRNNMSGYLRF